MLKIRYFVRLIIAFVQRFKAILIIAIFVGAILFFLLRAFLERQSVSYQSIGITGRYKTSTLPVSILSKISTGLTKIEADGSVTTGIASSWYTPDEGKTWIFKINNDLLWQDGKKVVSSDISYKFDDVEEKYPDSQTVEFHLQNKYSAFPVIVSKPIFKKGLLGISEWKVDKLELSGSFVEKIQLVNSQKEKLNYYFFPTEERTKLAFKLGKVKQIEELTSATPFDEWKRIQIYENTLHNEYAAVFFNNKDSVFGEKSLRQALSYAIDKSLFKENRAISPISPDSWAYNSQVKKYETDIEKAKDMISEYKKASQRDKIEITLSTYPGLLSIAEKIANNWREVGVEVKVVSVTSDINEFQALLAILSIPSDPDQYSMWHSTQNTTNITHYENPRIDKLLEDGRNEMDVNLRKKIYLDFQRFLIEDAPAVFLYYPKSYTISR